jgi:hypothetical protein
LTKVVEKVIAEESGETLRKRITELEEENSRLKVTAVKLQGLVDSSTETIAML